MPRAARTVGEVEIEKKKIIGAAMEILYKEGFELLSMKNIGSRLGMTAANLYNYFSSKDELYIEMRRYGFLELYDRLDSAFREGESLEERIKNLIREYVRFGLEEVYAYDLLFSTRTSYHKYKNTPLEAIADREMESSIRIFDLAIRCIRESADNGKRQHFDESTAAILLWSYLHGAISLHNNNMMWMAAAAPSRIMETTTNALYVMIFDVLQNPALADVKFE
ncbi:MAG: TetR/AcrR family transcriptional regulator [Proteobacteria bacterium]|nr:TetR/AcrR family transcriptional regulator [Pseudomonadota bacterium]